jgi:hypothetical protein
MPAIKVYKGNGLLIPVEDAKIAKAYQCPWTDTLYATKRAYVKHLKDLRETRMHKRARKNRWDRKFADFYNQPTIQDIIKWIELNPEFFYDNGLKSSWPYQARKLEKENVREKFSFKITYLDLTWSDWLSNSHSAPRGKQTNWGGDKKDVPRGYPGWGGKIEYEMSHDLGFGSDIVKGLGINTGTGGGRGDNAYGYDVKLFADDWPGLFKTMVDSQEKYERDGLLDNIKGALRPWNPPPIKYGTPKYFKNFR